MFGLLLGLRGGCRLFGRRGLGGLLLWQGIRVSIWYGVLVLFIFVFVFVFVVVVVFDLIECRYRC